MSPRLESAGRRARSGARALLARTRRSRLCEMTSRRWTDLSRRRQRAALAVCAVVAAVGLAVTIFGLAERQKHVGGHQEDPVAEPARIGTATRPVIVRIQPGSAEAITTTSRRQRRDIARNAAKVILRTVESSPSQVVVIDLEEVPLSFDALSAYDRRQLQTRLGRNAAELYESAVAGFIDGVFDAVEKEHPRATLSVLGLPVEPEEAGVSLATARRTNARYHGVIDRLDAFVPARRLVVFGSSLDESTLARMGMREALRLREGQPIVFQTNRRWRAFLDPHAVGHLSQTEALLTDDPYSDP